MIYSPGFFLPGRNNRLVVPPPRKKKKPQLLLGFHLLQVSPSLRFLVMTSSFCPFMPSGGNRSLLLLVPGCFTIPCWIPYLCPHLCKESHYLTLLNRPVMHAISLLQAPWLVYNSSFRSPDNSQQERLLSSLLLFQAKSFCWCFLITTSSYPSFITLITVIMFLSVTDI